MEEVEKIYNEYRQEFDTKEQYKVSLIALLDRILQFQYNDLKENFSEKHKLLFIQNVKYLLSRIRSNK